MQAITVDEFSSRTGLSLRALGFDNWRLVERVVSLRAMVHIEAVSAMPLEYLKGLLESVGLVHSPEVKVFRGREIRLARLDPNILLIGQRFVYREKYTQILEKFGHVFKNFAVPRGIAKLTAVVILGIDSRGVFSMAHYLPPIVEIHDGKLPLMDGIHRNFIIRQSGTTIESILVEDVKIPFPCSVKDWDKIEVTETKPEKQEDRFFDLRPELFRDLKSIGIDG